MLHDLVRCKAFLSCSRVLCVTKIKPAQKPSGRLNETLTWIFTPQCLVSRLPIGREEAGQSHSGAVYWPSHSGDPYNNWTLCIFRRKKQTNGVWKWLECFILVSECWIGGEGVFERNRVTVFQTKWNGTFCDGCLTNQRFSTVLVQSQLCVQVPSFIKGILKYAQYQSKVWTQTSQSKGFVKASNYEWEHMEYVFN